MIHMMDYFWFQHVLNAVLHSPAFYLIRDPVLYVVEFDIIRKDDQSGSKILVCEMIVEIFFSQIKLKKSNISTYMCLIVCFLSVFLLFLSLSVMAFSSVET